MSWTPSTEPTLDALSSSLVAADAARTQALPADQKGVLKSHIDALAECLAVGLVFLAGFEDIAAGGPLAQSAAQPVKDWVATVPRDQGAVRLAGMMASSVCSVLEDYIAYVGPLRLTPSALANLRQTGQQLPADDHAAIAELLKKVRPSVKANGAIWLGGLGKVFGVGLTAEEQDMLQELITFRNLYIHDPPKAFAMTIRGDELKCWTTAAMLLCHRIAIS